jgi:hypothetical protein
MKTAILMVLLTGLVSAARADDSNGGSEIAQAYRSFHLRGDVNYVVPRNSENAMELGAAGLIFPIAGKEIEMGPRLNFLTASLNGQTRHTWYVGFQSGVWIMNAFAPTLGVDWVASSALDRDHYRVEPMVDIRVVHLGNDGALAVRLGVPYEEATQWGFRIGITVQMSALE